MPKYLKQTKMLFKTKLPVFPSLFLSLLFVMVGFLSLVHPNTAQATSLSWLSGYAYRIKIPVNATAAGAQTDYQINLDIHSGTGTSSAGAVYLNNHLQDTTNFNDIRFTADDGSTLKSYWIQAISPETGGVKATVYVKLDTPASGTTDYYLYYGKADDTSASSYDNTFTKDFGESGLVGLWHMDEQVPGPELLQNGGFENWTGAVLDNWTMGATSTGIRDIGKENSIVNSGSSAVKLTATANNSTGFGIYQDITTTSNQNYQVTLYQRYATSTAGSLKFEAYDNIHATSLASQTIATAGTSTSYSLVNFRFTSASTTSVRIKIYLNSETSGAAYIDSVSVMQSGNTLTDSTTANSPGTIYGAARTGTDGGAWGNTNQQFSSGSSLNFDGKDDYVNLGKGAGLNNLTKRSVSFWLYPGPTGNNDIIGKGYNAGFVIKEYSSGNQTIDVYEYYDNTSARSMCSNIVIPGQWEYITTTYDESGDRKIHVYKNGVEQSCGTQTPSAGNHKDDSSFNLALGQVSYGYYQGVIDEVRVYNRVLTQSEISRQYIRSKHASIAPAWSVPGNEEQFNFAINSNPATLISDSGATLGGYLAGLGDNISVNAYFKYGISHDSLNNSTAPQALSSQGTFIQAITGLSPNTTYYFQAVADGSTPVSGDILSFNTAFVASDYYYAFTNSDGTLSFTNKNTGATILDSSPKYYLNYGSATTTDVTFSNASFENSTLGQRPAGWSITLDNPNTAISVSSDYASEGTWSLKANLVNIDSSGRSLLSPLITINQETTYTISVDSYFSRFASGGEITLYALYWKTADGSGGAYNSSVSVNFNSTTGSWHNTTLVWTTPAEAKSFKVFLWMTPTTHDTTVYFDNISILENTNIYTSNSTNITSNISISGGDIVVTSVDDTNPFVTVSNRYELSLHSPYITYIPTLTYKQDVTTTEERFDFVVPSQTGSIMTRDLRIVTLDPAATYYSDFYTPKVAKFNNGMFYLGNDTMQSMRVQSQGLTNSQVSFYSDDKFNHPFFYYVKNGGNATVDISAQIRKTGDTYASSVTFGIDPYSALQSLVKARQPYGYDATLIFTNHADSETLATVNAPAYGTEDTTDPAYGAKGIVGRGLGWTKSVFVSGQTGADLQDATFKQLNDKMYQDGVEIVGHSITPNTDIRSVVDNGMQTLSQNYGSRNWIDHGASFGSGNWEDLASQGTVKGDPNYTLDLFAQHGYDYAWSYNDFTTTNAHDPNMLDPANTRANTSYFYYNNNVDDNPGNDNKIYLWSTLNTGKAPDLYYTSAKIDNFISQRGVHLGHEYMGFITTQNHSWYIAANGKKEIYPAFDDGLAYIAAKKQAGQIWSPTIAGMGDYLVSLKDVIITNNVDGTYTVSNTGTASVTGVTLLAESAIKSVAIDGKQLTSFGGSASGHDKQLVLPTLAPGQSITLAITYGTKDSTLPIVVSNDTGKNKINELAGKYDSVSKVFTLTAEGKGDHSFTATVPDLAGAAVEVTDITNGDKIGSYVADSSGNITFTGHLGSVHTFSIAPDVSGSSYPVSSGGGGATYPSIYQVTISSTTPTSTLISWRTDYNTPSEVTYGTSTTYGLSVKNDVASTTHSLILDNLAPATTYHYQIKASLNGISSYSGDKTFTTLTIPATVCQPRPACLDNTPACMIAEPVGSWCSASSTPESTSSVTPTSGNGQGFSPSGNVIRLINDRGTYYLIFNGQRQGVTSLGILYSYGLELKDGKAATAADMILPNGPLLLPGNGALVKSKQDLTVYLISDGQRYGFTSAKIFTGLGFKFASVLVVTDPELQALPKAGDLGDSTAAHMDGTDININGTIYYISRGKRCPYPSLAIYNSWHKDGDFSLVSKANSKDLMLPVGEAVLARTMN